MMKKFGFALIIFVLVFAVPVTVYTIISGSSDSDTRDLAADSDSDETEEANLSIPQIVSVPATEVLVGDMYSYQIKAIDDDGDTLEYQVRKYPSWMMWDSDLRVLEGKPSGAHVGVHRVEIVVTDGKWLQTHAFDVVVAEEETDLETISPSAEDSVSLEGSLTDQYQEASDSDESGGRVVSENQTPTPISSPEDYGFMPIDQIDAQSADSAVLGEATTLPNTASFTGILGISVGAGIVAVALFMLADARWNISEDILSRVQYERGHQVGMKMGKGVVVKKRKVRL